jgi:hypothetical protein
VLAATEGQETQRIADERAKRTAAEQVPQDKLQWFRGHADAPLVPLPQPDW